MQGVDTRLKAPVQLAHQQLRDRLLVLDGLLPAQALFLGPLRQQAVQGKRQQRGRNAVADHIQLIETQAVPVQGEVIEDVARHERAGMEQPFHRDARQPQRRRQQGFLHAGGGFQVVTDGRIGFGQGVVDPVEPPVAFVQFLLQPQDAFAGANPHPQLLGMDRLDDKIVGPRIHALHQRGAVVATAQQDQIDIIVEGGGTDTPT